MEGNTTSVSDVTCARRKLEGETIEEAVFNAVSHCFYHVMKNNTIRKQGMLLFLEHSRISPNEAADLVVILGAFYLLLFIQGTVPKLSRNYWMGFLFIGGGRFLILSAEHIYYRILIAPEILLHFMSEIDLPFRMSTAICNLPLVNNMQDVTILQARVVWLKK